MSKMKQTKEDVPPSTSSAAGGTRLASNKYFQPKDLNDLNRIGKQPLPGVRRASANRAQKPQTNAQAQSSMGNRALIVRNTGDLKKIDAPRTIQYSESSANIDNTNNPWDNGPLAMNSSVQSFYSEREAQIDDEQRGKIAQATRKPFEMRKSQTGFKKATNVDDDLLSEISTPDINYNERSKIMEVLNQREKDRQELELEECFDQLISKAQGVDSNDIEQVANRSAKDFRESGKMNIFKPQLKGMTPRKSDNPNGVSAGLVPVKASHPGSSNIAKRQSQLVGASLQQLNNHPSTKIQTWVDRPSSVSQAKDPVQAQHASRLDAIYAQLKDLQNLKDEICDDLDDFVSEVDRDENVQMPQHMDQVVDIVVNQERERNERIEATTSEYGEDSQQLKDAMEELEADDANPFWKRLLEPEKAYGVDLTQPIAPMLEKALNTGFSSQAGYTNERAFQAFNPAQQNQSEDYEETKGEPAGAGGDEKERKKMKEMAKIRQNELALAQLNKKRHQMKIDTTLNQSGLPAAEQEDQEAKPSTPQLKRKNTKPLSGKPPSSNKAPSRKQMAQMAEAAINGAMPGGFGDTFLTDMLMTGKTAGGGGVGAKKKGKATFQTASKPNFRSGSASKNNRVTPTKDNFDPDESEAMSDYEDEYRDVVMDVENSRALVQVADDYLSGKDEEPFLALPAPGDDLDISGIGNYDDDTKSMGGDSRASGKSGMSKLSDRNFVAINRSAQSKIRPFLRQQRPTDRLAPDQRARLEEMVQEIEDNIDDLLLEKEEYFKGDGQQSVSRKSKIIEAPNSYSLEGDTKSRMDEIDNRLRIRNPGAQDNYSAAPSLGSLQLPGSGLNAGVGGKDLMNLSVSQFSQLDAMSSISRRSNLTMITLKSHMTSASGKVKALPREGRLRENAIRRMNDAQIKEIENHLRKIRNSNDLSYSNVKSSQPTTGGDQGAAAESEFNTERKMIDPETLMRLIDECKEEEDRIQVIAGVEEHSVQEQIDQQKQQTHNQLVRFEQVSNVLGDADAIAEKARKLEAETFELTQQLDQGDEQFAKDVEAYYKMKKDGVMEGFEQFVNKVKDFGIDSKHKISELEAEMQTIGDSLEKRENEIAHMQEQFEKQEDVDAAFMAGLDDEQRQLLKDNQIEQPFESKVRHLIDEETEQEDEDRLAQVMADLEEFQKQQAEQEYSDAQNAALPTAEQANPLRNVDIIEEIMADQTIFEAQVDEFLEEEQKKLAEQESILSDAQKAMASTSDNDKAAASNQENRALLADIPEEVINQLSAAVADNNTEETKQSEKEESGEQQ